MQVFGPETVDWRLLSFLRYKDVNKGTWTSISAHAGKRLFHQYTSKFKKEWRDSFSRIQGTPECSTASVLVDGKPKFLLRWADAPLAVMGYDFAKMRPYERCLVCFLEKFPLINIHELLDREGDIKSMDAYMCELFCRKIVCC